MPRYWASAPPAIRRPSPLTPYEPGPLRAKAGRTHRHYAIARQVAHAADLETTRSANHGSVTRPPPHHYARCVSTASAPTDPAGERGEMLPAGTVCLSAAKGRRC